MKKWEDLSLKEQTPEGGYREAVRRIKVCKAKKQTNLDLDRLQLTSLPPELAELTDLQRLDITRNRLVDVQPLSQLKRLTTLHLNNNQLTDLHPLKELIRLTKLQARDNQLTDLAPLAGMHRLTLLSLDNNQLTDLQPLSGMYGLYTLSLSGNRVTDIGPLIKSDRLTTLYLSNNQITNLEPLSRMKNLSFLNLKNNRITDLGPLAGLDRLKNLELDNNPIKSLRHLTNWLSQDPAIHFKSTYEKGLHLKNVSLVDPPNTVVQQGVSAIFSYWSELDSRKTETNNEGRVLIVGRGGVGKTTLLEKLRREDFTLDPDQEQTHGINIWPDWTFSLPDRFGGNFRASVWDFGGQDIQHLTHQYFFSPRTVFVLVVNKRGMNVNEEATELHYWFRIIDLLGRQADEKARVMVVQNVFNNEKTNAGVDLAPYEKAYGDCLDLSFHRVNFGAHETAFIDLRGALQRSLLAVPGVGDARPGGWAAVRAELGKLRGKRRIAWDTYADVCTKHKITTEAGQLLLCRYLMQLGELLYYEKGSGALSESLLLDIDWVTKSVYGITGDQKIIDESGRFREEQIVAYWKSIDIASGRDHNLMLALLQTNAFELCWRTPDGTFLTPTLFHVEEPAYEFVQTNLGLRLNYHYLPKGLLGQVIVRLHDYLEAQESFWRYGAYLQHDNCRARIARPGLTTADNSFITVDVAGESPQNYAFLSIISQAFDIVHRQSFPRIRVTREVPCPCKRCKDPERRRHYFSYDRLERDQADGDQEAYCINNRPTSITLLLRGLSQVNHPEVMGIISEARQMIENDDLTEAFRLILHRHPNDDLRVISSNWKRLMKEKMTGTIRQEELSVQSAKITQGLLDYLTLLENQLDGL